MSWGEIMEEKFDVTPCPARAGRKPTENGNMH